MNSNEYKFDHYIASKIPKVTNVLESKCGAPSFVEEDIHPNITKVNTLLAESPKLTNVMYYGPNGVGKYACALHYISKFSPSKLGYEKKMTVESSKGEIIIKISDIHFEIDMGLLGCNSKQIWNDIIKHIHEVTSLRKATRSFILCKNFHNIHNELLEVFYSYMQTTSRANRIQYIITTNCLSFIPDNIVKRCLCINVPRPTKQSLSMIHKIPKTLELCDIHSIKKWRNGVSGSLHDNLVNELIEIISNLGRRKEYCKEKSDVVNDYDATKSTTSVTEQLRIHDYALTRDRIYDITVMNFNISDVIWDIFKKLVMMDRIPEDKSLCVMDEIYRILELLSNNYRPIYHLERYIYFLATIVNEL